MSFRPFYKTSKTSLEEISRISYKPDSSRFAVDDDRKIALLFATFEKHYNQARRRLLIFSFMKLREKFTDYLRRRIAVAKINRMIKNNLQEKCTHFFEKIKGKSAKNSRAKEQSKKPPLSVKSLQEETSNAYEVFNTYLTNATPTKALTNKAIEKVFNTQKFLTALVSLFKNARTKYDAFSILKRPVFLASQPRSISLDISISHLKDIKGLNTRKYNIDPAFKNRYANGAKKLSDFVFKHKESAFYHLKARTIFPCEGRGNVTDRSSLTRETYKSRFSQFFASRKSRNMRSMDENRNKDDTIIGRLSNNSHLGGSSDNQSQIRSNNSLKTDSLSFNSPAQNYSSKLKATTSLSPNIKPFSPFSREDGRKMGTPLKSWEFSKIHESPEGGDSANATQFTERDSVRRDKLSKLSKIVLNQIPAFKEKHLEKYLRYEHSCYQIIRIFKGALKRELYYSFENVKNWGSFDPRVHQKMVRIINKWKARHERALHKYLMRWRDNAKRNQLAASTFRNLISLLSLRKKMALEKAFLKIQLAAVSIASHSKTPRTSPFKTPSFGVNFFKSSTLTSPEVVSPNPKQKKATTIGFILILEKFMRVRRNESIFKAFRSLQNFSHNGIRRDMKVEQGFVLIKEFVVKKTLSPSFIPLQNHYEKKLAEEQEAREQEAEIRRNERKELLKQRGAREQHQGGLKIMTIDGPLTMNKEDAENKLQKGTKYSNKQQSDERSWEGRPWVDTTERGRSGPVQKKSSDNPSRNEFNSDESGESDEGAQELERLNRENQKLRSQIHRKNQERKRDHSFEQQSRQEMHVIENFTPIKDFKWDVNQNEEIKSNLSIGRVPTSEFSPVLSARRSSNTVQPSGFYKESKLLSKNADSTKYKEENMVGRWQSNPVVATQMKYNHDDYDEIRHTDEHDIKPMNKLERTSEKVQGVSHEIKQIDASKGKRQESPKRAQVPPLEINKINTTEKKQPLEFTKKEQADTIEMKHIDTIESMHSESARRRQVDSDIIRQSYKAIPPGSKAASNPVASSAKDKEDFDELEELRRQNALLIQKLDSKSQEPTFKHKPLGLELAVESTPTVRDLEWDDLFQRNQALEEQLLKMRNLQEPTSNQMQQRLILSKEQSAASIEENFPSSRTKFVELSPLKDHIPSTKYSELPPLKPHFRSLSKDSGNSDEIEALRKENTLLKNVVARLSRDSHFSSLQTFQEGMSAIDSQPQTERARNIQQHPTVSQIGDAIERIVEYEEVVFVPSKISYDSVTNIRRSAGAITPDAFLTDRLSDKSPHSFQPQQQQNRNEAHRSSSPHEQDEIPYQGNQPGQDEQQMYQRQQEKPKRGYQEHPSQKSRLPHQFAELLNQNQQHELPKENQMHQERRSYQEQPHQSSRNQQSISELQMHQKRQSYQDHQPLKEYQAIRENQSHKDIQMHQNYQDGQPYKKDNMDQSYQSRPKQEPYNESKLSQDYNPNSKSQHREETRSYEAHQWQSEPISYRESKVNENYQVGRKDEDYEEGMPHQDFQSHPEHQIQKKHQMHQDYQEQMHQGFQPRSEHERFNENETYEDHQSNFEHKPFNESGLHYTYQSSPDFKSTHPEVNPPHLKLNEAYKEKEISQKNRSRIEGQSQKQYQPRPNDFESELDEFHSDINQSSKRGKVSQDYDSKEDWSQKQSQSHLPRSKEDMLSQDYKSPQGSHSRKQSQSHAVLHRSSKQAQDYESNEQDRSPRQSQTHLHHFKEDKLAQDYKSPKDNQSQKQIGQHHPGIHQPFEEDLSSQNNKFNREDESQMQHQRCPEPNQPFKEGGISKGTKSNKTDQSQRESQHRPEAHQPLNEDKLSQTYRSPKNIQRQTQYQPYSELSQHSSRDKLSQDSKPRKREQSQKQSQPPAEFDQRHPELNQSYSEDEVNEDYKSDKESRSQDRPEHSQFSKEDKHAKNSLSQKRNQSPKQSQPHSEFDQSYSEDELNQNYKSPKEGQSTTQYQHRPERRQSSKGNNLSQDNKSRKKDQSPKQSQPHADEVNQDYTFPKGKQSQMRQPPRSELSQPSKRDNLSQNDKSRKKDQSPKHSQPRSELNQSYSEDEIDQGYKSPRDNQSQVQYRPRSELNQPFKRNNLSQDRKSRKRDHSPKQPQTRPKFNQHHSELDQAYSEDEISEDYKSPKGDQSQMEYEHHLPLGEPSKKDKQSRKREQPEKQSQPRPELNQPYCEDEMDKDYKSPRNIQSQAQNRPLSKRSQSSKEDMPLQDSRPRKREQSPKKSQPHSEFNESFSEDELNQGYKFSKDNRSRMQYQPRPELSQPFKEGKLSQASNPRKREEYLSHPEFNQYPPELNQVICKDEAHQVYKSPKENQHRPELNQVSKVRKQSQDNQPRKREQSEKRSQPHSDSNQSYSEDEPNQNYISPKCNQSQTQQTPHSELSQPPKRDNLSQNDKSRKKDQSPKQSQPHSELDQSHREDELNQDYTSPRDSRSQIHRRRRCELNQPTKQDNYSQDSRPRKREQPQKQSQPRPELNESFSEDELIQDYKSSKDNQPRAQNQLQQRGKVLSSDQPHKNQQRPNDQKLHYSQNSSRGSPSGRDYQDYQIYQPNKAHQLNESYQSHQEYQPRKERQFRQEDQLSGRDYQNRHQKERERQKSPYSHQRHQSQEEYPLSKENPDLILYKDHQQEALQENQHNERSRSGCNTLVYILDKRLSLCYAHFFGNLKLRQLSYINSHYNKLSNLSNIATKYHRGSFKDLFISFNAIKETSNQVKKEMELNQLNLHSRSTQLAIKMESILKILRIRNLSVAFKKIEQNEISTQMFRKRRQSELSKLGANLLAKLLGLSIQKLLKIKFIQILKDMPPKQKGSSQKIERKTAAEKKQEAVRYLVRTVDLLLRFKTRLTLSNSFTEIAHFSTSRTMTALQKEYTDKARMTQVKQRQKDFGKAAENIVKAMRLKSLSLAFHGIAANVQIEKLRNDFNNEKIAKIFRKAHKYELAHAFYKWKTDLELRKQELFIMKNLVHKGRIMGKHTSSPEVESENKSLISSRHSYNKTPQKDNIQQLSLSEIHKTLEEELLSEDEERDRLKRPYDNPTDQYQSQSSAGRPTPYIQSKKGSLNSPVPQFSSDARDDNALFFTQPIQMPTYEQPSSSSKTTIIPQVLASTRAKYGPATGQPSSTQISNRSSALNSHISTPNAAVTEREHENDRIAQRQPAFTSRSSKPADKTPSSSNSSQANTPVRNLLQGYTDDIRPPIAPTQGKTIRDRQRFATQGSFEPSQLNKHKNQQDERDVYSPKLSKPSNPTYTMTINDLPSARNVGSDTQTADFGKDGSSGPDTTRGKSMLTNDSRGMLEMNQSAPGLNYSRFLSSNQPADSPRKFSIGGTHPILELRDIDEKIQRYKTDSLDDIQKSSLPIGSAKTEATRHVKGQLSAREAPKSYETDYAERSHHNRAPTNIYGLVDKRKYDSDRELPVSSYAKYKTLKGSEFSSSSTNLSQKKANDYQRKLMSDSEPFEEEISARLKSTQRSNASQEKANYKSPQSFQRPELKLNLNLLQNKQTPSAPAKPNYNIDSYPEQPSRLNNEAHRMWPETARSLISHKNTFSLNVNSLYETRKGSLQSPPVTNIHSSSNTPHNELHKSSTFSSMRASPTVSAANTIRKTSLVIPQTQQQISSLSRRPHGSQPSITVQYNQAPRWNEEARKDSKPLSSAIYSGPTTAEASARQSRDYTKKYYLNNISRKDTATDIRYQVRECPSNSLESLPENTADNLSLVSDHQVSPDDIDTCTIDPITGKKTCELCGKKFGGGEQCQDPEDSHRYPQNSSRSQLTPKEPNSQRNFLSSIYKPEIHSERGKGKDYEDDQYNFKGLLDHLRNSKTDQFPNSRRANGYDT